MRKSSGFTLIELLVVISIIGVISSIVLASLNTARAKSRDAVRFQNLIQIRNALELYYDKCGTYILRQNCTGSAYGSNGLGWFNHPYVPAVGSVGKGLVDHGFLAKEVMDPSGMITSNGSTRSGYMIYVNSVKYTIWVNLERPTAANIATQNTCYFSGYDNYSSTTYQVAARMNFCISN